MTTYLPRHFEERDLDRLHDLIDAHPLAMWVSTQDGELVVHHIPALLDRSRGPFGTLIAHVARANPVWRSPAKSLWVFRGPEAYISPTWLPGKAEHGKVVPTWNYATVHAVGTPTVLDDRDQVLNIVERLTQRHEAGMPRPWQVSDAPADYIERLLGAIVGIELPIEQLTGKFKLSQNRGADEQAGIAAGLGEGPMQGLMRRGL